jgi:uncharacterized membrane protein
MWGEPNERERTRRTLERTARALESFLLVFLGIIAVAIIVVAILMIGSMDDASGSQGGRLFVALAAVVLLGAVDSQIERVMRRRRRFSLTRPTRYGRYSLLSLPLLAVAAVVLFGCALYLP